MPDQLIGDDKLLALCLATIGENMAERRIGERQQKSQSRYSYFIEMNKETMPEWIKAIKKYGTYGKMHFTNEAVESKIQVDIKRSKVPNEYQGNYGVYQVANKIVGKISDREIKGIILREEYETWHKCLQSGINRSGTQLDLKEQKRHISKMEEMIKVLVSYSSLEIFMEELNHKRVGEHNRIVNKSKWDRSDMKVYTKRDKSVSKCGIDMIVLGAIRLLKIDGEIYPMTENHYDRLISYISTLRKSILSHKDLPLKVKPDRIPVVLNKMAYYVSKYDVGKVGEVLKAARQMAFLKLELSEIMGNSCRLYSRAIDPGRAEMASTCLGIAYELSDDNIVQSNILGFYKSVPHPDAPIHDMFESIKGVKEPNKCNKQMEMRLEGVLRRSLYASMKKSGHDVRLKSRTKASKHLADTANDVTQKAGAVTRMDSNTWYDTNFEIVRSIIGVEDMIVPIASKASSAGILMTTTQEQEARAYFAGYGDRLPDCLKRPTTVNDASTEIRGVNRMKIENSIKRFEKVIDLHEKFESKYPNLDIEDIPSEDLEKFLEGHPMAQYIVNTEGKFGEVHKSVTRLFYMAEQELKTLTQRVERLAKQVSRNQSGVSIVKGFLGRRSDLERSVLCMTGKTDDQRSIAVSFDMSEFSKKFPMSLVRLYGRILKEITGEDFLDRIDLFFRAAKVMYSNRGYYNHIRGTKGGFEGFLNFMWSSIHAAIMEVALETTGVNGELLTFSDDGLLIFYPKAGTHDSDISRLIEKIRDTFLDLGLVFHLGKTMVSDHMWEYLGDICYNNRLLPSWFKELTKLGKLNPSRGVTPLYDKIKMVNSQASAFIVSSGDPITAYVLKRYECHRILRGWIPRTDHLLEEVLFSLPTSCGGLRITSPFEDTCSTTISNDSEVYADLVLLEKIDKGLFAKITSTILSKISKFSPTRDNCKTLLTNPTVFKTTLPDTSGGGSLRMLVDKVRVKSNYTVPKDPLDKHVSYEIYEILTEMASVDMRAISLLVNSLPGISEYQSFCGILKGNGVLKLASRADVRKAQRRDTNSVRNAIRFWDKVIHGSNVATNMDFLDLCFRFTHPDIDIIKFRLSPRLVLRRCEREDDPHIEVKYGGSNSRDIYNADYKEPTLKAPSDPTTLSWNSEATGDRTLKDERKFLNLVNRIVNAYPNSEGSIRSICKIFNLTPPLLISGGIRGAHRGGRAKMKVTDARLILPRFHMYHIKSRYLGRLSLYLEREPRADRTTYLRSAEALAYWIHTSIFPINDVQNGGNEFYYYKIDTDLFTNCFPINNMSDTDNTIDPGPDTEIGARLVEEYLMASRENEEYLNNLAMIDFASREEDYVDDEASRLLIDGMIQQVERFLVSAYNATKTVILTDSTLPRISKLRNYILKRAIIGASLEVMDPKKRVEFSSLINRNRERETLDRILDSEHMMTLFSYFTYMYTLLPLEIVSMTPYITRESIEREPEEFLNILVSYFFDMSLLSNNSMVIFFSKDYRANQFSNEHKVAYRKVFRETIRSMFAAFARCKWNEDKLREKYPSIANMPIDEQIDCLKVFYNIIRSSKHRNSPYNSKSAIIELMKFYKMVSSMIRRLRSEGLHTLDDFKIEAIVSSYKKWVLPDRDKREIKDSVGNLGQDHLANLDRVFKEGVVRRAATRMKAYAKRGVLPSCISRNLEVKLVEVKRMQTAFNETVMVQARNKVKPYHTKVASYVRNEFMNISTKHTPVANIDSNVNCITGKDVSETYPEDEVVELFINHLDIIKYTKGIIGFRTSDDFHGTVADAVATEYKLEGQRFVPTVGMIGDNSDYKIFNIKCPTVNHALTTFMNITRDYSSSASIIRMKDKVDINDIVFNIEEDPEEESSMEEESSVEYSDESSYEESEESEESGDQEEASAGEDIKSEKSGEKRKARRYVKMVSDSESASEESSRSIEKGNGSDASDSDYTQVEKDDPKYEEGFAYYVMGVTAKQEFDIQEHIEPKVSSGITDVISELIDNLSIADSLRETRSIISSLTTSSARTHDYRTTGYRAVRASNLFTPGKQVNDKHTTLQAAYILSRDIRQPSSVIAAYCYTKAFLTNKRTKEEIIGIFRDFQARYNDEEQKVKLRRDIAYVDNWLSSSNISAGRELETRAVNRLVKYGLLAVKNIHFNGDTSTTTSRFRSFDEAFKLARAEGNVELGDMSTLLYDATDNEEAIEFDLGELEEESDGSEDWF